MGGGKKSFLATAALAAAGCTTDDGQLSVRTIADPIATASKRGGPMLAEARSMLALNNVGLALEAFRKALRQQPDSVEALAGIAECYERMGRFDLSRVNYEAALAIAPNNPVLLNTFAVSLQRQGRFAEANALRAEAAEAEATDVAITVQMAQADIASATAAAAPAPAAHREDRPPTVRVAAAKSAPVSEVAAAKPASVTGIKAKPVPVVQVAAGEPVVKKLAPIARSMPTPRPAEVDERKVAVHTEVVGNTKWTIEVPKVATAAPHTAPVVTAPIEVIKTPVPITPTQAGRVAASAQPMASQKSAPVAQQASKAAQKEAVAARDAAPPKLTLANVAPVAPSPIGSAVSNTPAKQTAARDHAPASPAPAKPGPKSPIRSEALAVAQPQLRLERLSMGEVALLTRDAPAWRTDVVTKTRTSITARFVPLKREPADGQKMASANFVPLKSASADKEHLTAARFVPLKTAMAANRPNIRLLNAARYQGLAARTRMTLFDRGWRKIAIGDAAQVRARSIVLYPANRQVLGKRLAAQFGFASAINYRSDEVLVLLGRDASAMTVRRARG